METSTRVLAAGCTISNSLIMVAPSLEMVVLWPSNTNLSIPRGPSVVFTASATAWHALILEIIWALPWEVSVPSRSRIIWGWKAAMIDMCEFRICVGFGCRAAFCVSCSFFEWRVGFEIMHYRIPHQKHAFRLALN
jgi:hypothetical protein